MIRITRQARRGLNRGWTLPLALALAAWFAGCSASLVQLDAEESADRLAFLVDGVTSADDLEFRLGSPAGSFEKGRIAIYRHCDTTGCNEPLQLVVIFDDAEIVLRHSIVVTR